MDVAAAAERRQRVAAVFDRSASTYDAVGVPWFTPIAERLVREVAPAPRERILDVGCGRGAALFALAEAVGPTGEVTGIDLAPGMVAATLADVQARGHTNVTLHVMDAAMPHLELSSYDAVVASLVVFFLPDPEAGLRAWRDLLVPDGRIGISTFGERDPRWAALDDVFRPYLPPQLLDARTSGVSGPFASDEGVEELLRAAGYVQPRTVGQEVSVTFSDTDQWHDWSWSHGQRAMWEAVPKEARDAVRAEAYELLEGCREPDGRISLAQRVRFTLADRGGGT